MIFPGINCFILPYSSLKIKWSPSRILFQILVKEDCQGKNSSCLSAGLLKKKAYIYCWKRSQVCHPGTWLLSVTGPKKNFFKPNTTGIKTFLLTEPHQNL